MTPKQGPLKPRDEFVRVRITSEQRGELRQLASEDGMTESELVRRLIADEVRRRQPKARRG